jgi:hypothetical protein
MTLNLFFSNVMEKINNIFSDDLDDSSDTDIDSLIFFGIIMY